MNRLKRVACLALGTALSMSLLAACGSTGTVASATPSASAPASEPAQSAPSYTTVETGKLHMATNAAFPPYEMVKDDGTTYEGIDVEIAQKIAEKMGLTLVVDDMDFNAALAAAQTGKDDIVMAGVTVTPERQQNMDFTNSYATGVQVIIVPQDSTIQGPNDLKDKMIGTQEGTTGYLYCSADPADGGYGADHVIAYTNGATAIQALLGGKVDAVVIDNEPAKAFVAANSGLKILDTKYITENYAIGVSKNNPGLTAELNSVLDELTADGTIQTIVDKYIAAK